MKMHTLGVVGLGKLGLPLAATLAMAGHSVIAVDKDEIVVDSLLKDKFNYVEPELNEYLREASSRLEFTTDFQRLDVAELIYLIVPTPSNNSGFFINNFLLNAISSIGSAWKLVDEHRILVIVSTVMPGSTRNELIPCLEEAVGRKIGQSLEVLYSPEFIAIGSVISDLHNPDLLLIGGRDQASIEKHVEVIGSVVRSKPTVRTLNLEEAELVKILINNYVTMKITFANHIAELTDSIPGTDSKRIAEAIGNDSRIGSKYLRPGLGFGGPCFPRDTRALVAFSREKGLKSEIADSVEKINSRQPSVLANRILNLYPDVKTVGIYGLAYKEGSSLIEESQAIMLAHELLNRGLNVYSFDPLMEDCDETELLNLGTKRNLEKMRVVDLLIHTQTIKPSHLEILNGVPKFDLT